jgi:hypothetical protein
VSGYTGNIGLVRSGIWAILALLAVPCLIFAILFAIRGGNPSWSGSMFSSRPSLTGVWVGKLTIHSGPLPAGSDLGGDRNVSEGQYAMKLHIQNVLLTLSPSIKGSAEICDAGGQHRRFKFNMGDVRQGNRLSVALDDVADYTAGGHLNGLWQEDRLNVSFAWRTSGVVGTLHKGSDSDFDALCRNLPQNH